MSKKAIVFWDCSLCSSKNIDFIQQLSNNLKVQISSIVVCAKEQKHFPPSLNDIATTTPVFLRFGKNAKLDSVVDVISFLAKCKGNCTFILVTSEFPIWINLFQRYPPKTLIFVSNQDPRTSFDFSFLSTSISYTVLQWPSLNELASQSGSTNYTQEAITESHIEKDYESDSNSKDNNDEISSAIEEHESLEDEEEEEDIQNSSQYNQSIEPLSNIDMYQNSLDLNSPSETETSSRIAASPEITPKKPQPPPPQLTTGQAISIPVKFQPLIEAMKSIGKAMISLTDLDGRLREFCEKYNQPVENISTYITRASDAGIIIYDKSINYVRFKNRTMANTPIEYV